MWQLPGGVCLGLFLDGDGTFSHEGQTGGFTTHFAHGEHPGSIVPPTLSVSPADLDAYVGSYELPSTFTITITRQGGELFAQGSGQSPLRVYASEKDIFYFRAVDAQLVFNRDDSGNVVSVTLDQNGAQQVGPRI